MKERKSIILENIIREYINSAKPVGSKLLADDFDLSSATIRNEMSLLEKEGLIQQPHTSAGRVPTEKGYLYYVDHFLREKQLDEKFNRKLHNIINQNKINYSEKNLKDLAKLISEYANETVIIAFSQEDVYYTGISKLLAKPEFYQPEIVYDLGKIIDQFDSVVSDIMSETEDKIKFKIGKNNPFGNYLSVVFSQCQLANKKGMIAILGAVRMDYDNNYSIVRVVSGLLGKNK